MAVTPYLQLFLPDGSTRVIDFVAGTADAMTKLDTWAAAHASGGGGGDGLSAPLRIVTTNTPRDPDGNVLLSATTDGTVLADATDGFFFVSLPDSPAGTTFRVVRIDAVPNSVLSLTTPDDSSAGFRNANELGAGYSTPYDPTSLRPGASVTMVSDGTDWWVTEINHPPIPSVFDLHNLVPPVPGSDELLMLWDGYQTEFVFGQTLGTSYGVYGISADGPYPAGTRYLSVDAANVPVTVDLWDASQDFRGQASLGAGMALTVILGSEDVQPAAHPATLQPVAGQTINGQPNLVLTVPGECVTLLSDGNNWFIASHSLPAGRVVPIDVDGYVSAPEEVILADASAGDLHMWLPRPTANMRVTFKKIDASANTVSVGPDGGVGAGVTIEGVDAFYVLDAQFQSRTFVCDGAGWWVV